MADALPDPFKAGGPSAGFVPGGPLDDLLKAKLKKAKHQGLFSQMGIALADLTDIGENPGTDRPFAIKFAAGMNLTTEMAVFSLAKLAPMLAAFRLRERAQVAADAVGKSASSPDDLFAQIAADWKPRVSNRIGLPPHDVPNLKHIFNPGTAAPWKLSFLGNRSFAALQVLDPPPFEGVPKATVKTLDFMDRLKLGVRWSCNNSAGSCVRDIGFQYMNGVMADEGFADNQRNGILFLGGDYGFAGSPIMAQPPWAHGKGSWVRANAKGIASFLALVWTNRLVSKAACIDMRDILKERREGLGTTMGNNVPSRVRVFSKVGIGGTTSEGCIIESHSGTKVIRYIAVGLGGSESALKELVVIFNDCIASLH